MTCPVSHLLGSECRDDPLLQERAQAPVDVSALTSNAPVRFACLGPIGGTPSHRRCAGHLIREIAPLQGKPRFRSPSTPGRITSYENPSSRLRQLNEARNSFHVVVDELKKRANRDGPFDAANAYEFRIFPVERFCALSLSRRGILILENWQERLPA